MALASGPTGAYLTAGKVYFKANTAGSFGFVATVTDTGSGPASATFPIERDGVDDPQRRVDTTPGGGPTRRATSCGRAARAHRRPTRSPGPTVGQHRHVGDHLHARLDGADRCGDRAGGGGERPRLGGGDVELGRRRLGSRLGAVPEFTRRCGNVVEPRRRRHRDAVRRRAGTPPRSPTGSTTSVSSPPTTSATPSRRRPSPTSGSTTPCRPDRSLRRRRAPSSRGPSWSRRIRPTADRGRQRAVPTFTCRREHVVERGGGRHHVAVHRELGHHGVVDGLYDLRVITTDKAGNAVHVRARNQCARRQHAPDGRGDRPGRRRRTCGARWR